MEKKSLQELISSYTNTQSQHDGTNDSINDGTNVGIYDGINVGTILLDAELNIKILKVLHNNPNTTIKNLASLLKISTRHAERKIAQLKRDGKLERVGAAKNGYWKVMT